MRSLCPRHSIENARSERRLVELSYHRRRETLRKIASDLISFGDCGAAATLILQCGKIAAAEIPQMTRLRLTTV
jgi:hypothetical protein